MCGAVRATNIGERIVLQGWLHRSRDHGGLIFVDLRDRSGRVQVVFNPERAPEAHAAIADGELRSSPEAELRLRLTIGDHQGTTSPARWHA